MRVQSTHNYDSRGLDPYFTPVEATMSLLHVERGKIPQHIWEPAAGEGNIASYLTSKGYDVIATDIKDYGYKDCKPNVDYLSAELPEGVEGIITNPPYKLAQEFLTKALSEVCYVAFLLRLNYLESVKRYSFFKKSPPTRVWVSSRRFPMMHRQGWEGNEANSNICFAWYVWDKKLNAKTTIDWFDWKNL